MGWLDKDRPKKALRKNLMHFMYKGGVGVGR